MTAKPSLRETPAPFLHVRLFDFGRLDLGQQGIVRRLLGRIVYLPDGFGFCPSRGLSSVGDARRFSTSSPGRDLGFEFDSLLLRAAAETTYRFRNFTTASVREWTCSLLYTPRIWKRMPSRLMPSWSLISL
jgi:hypothetical protein